MSESEYWEEAVSAGAEECGVVLTEDQLECIGQTVSNAHDSFSMAFYQPEMESPMVAERSEISRLKEELTEERNKRKCTECNGNGYIRLNGPSHYSDHDCHACNGEGRI